MILSLLCIQDHYDWGLRAIKSVLVVAGSLKRGDPERPEDQVLMRALRDFNLPKIVSDDNPGERSPSSITHGDLSVHIEGELGEIK